MKQAETIAMSKREKEHIISQAVSKYGDKLIAFIKPKVSSREDAEDILQEVWYQFVNLTNISEIVNIGSWLFRVSRNKITDNYRKKKMNNLEDLLNEDNENLSAISHFLLIDNAKNPELKLIQDDIWNELLKALDELPEKQRSVFIQNEFDGKTLQQIANEQNENVKTIISRKTYALNHLRVRLKQLYQDLNNT